MDFVTGAFATWLIERIADSGQAGLFKLVRGDEQDAALRRAADRAIRLTAEDFLEGESAEHLARVIDQAFGTDVPIAAPTQRATLLQNLHSAVIERAAVLGDSDLTGVGVSSADLFGISAAAIGTRLSSHLINEIKRRASRGGPLGPLATQINFDENDLRSRSVEDKLDDLGGSVATALRNIRSESPFLSDRHRMIAQERRYEASAWCDKVLGSNSIDFWESDWRQRLHQVMDTPRSLALTARGGSGKSVLAAHLVRHLLRVDPYSCLVVLHSPEDIRGGIAAVRNLVGAGSGGELARYVGVMRSAKHRVLFVIDGLDALIGAASTSSVATIIQELANLSCLLVTCRSELWERAFSHLSIEHQQLEPLNEAVVGQVILNHTGFLSWKLTILCLPFFLNAALLLKDSHAELPPTETGLLQGLLKLYAKPPRTPLPAWGSLELVFHQLAELQLASSSYEVSRTELLVALRDMHDARTALTHLESTGVFWRQSTSTQLTVRLNHDLLDCFNMARLLLDHDDARQRRETVYERAADLAGWTVLAMLAQITADLADEQLLREVFGELLRMLDRKRFGDIWMGRAWAATYVLRDKITVLIPLILECLAGQQVPSLRDPAETGGSCLGPQAAVTEEAASSLASAFDALDDWRAGFPDQAIPVLSAGLQRWELRKRFVEALSKYRDRAAVEALTNFGRLRLDEGDDPEILGEVAEALGRLGPGISDMEKRACIEILTGIIASPTIDARVRRAAIEAKNEVTSPILDPVPEITEEEIITYLDPLDHQRRSYSDWRVVKRYAEYAYKRIMTDKLTGKLSQPLLSALLRAFTHEQLFARTAVASCLGQVDDPAARNALITELLGPSLSWDVQQSCLDALDTQIREASKTPVLGALSRWLVLDAAQEATRLGSPAATALADLATRSAGINDLIVTPGGFEIVAARADTSFTLSVERVSSDQAPVADWIHNLVSPDDYASTGAGREPKYRIVAVATPGGMKMTVAMAQTTWEDGRSFHNAMTRAATAQRRNTDKIVNAWLAGRANFPGIACVHCIVVTSDGKVVKAKRSANTAYAAGLWSISFEEQITSVDFESARQDAATTAASRGFGEEFHLPADGCRMRVLSAIVELPIINMSLVVLAETDQPSEAFQHAAASANAPDQELTQIDFVDALPGQLLPEMERADLHPTSAIRVMAYARFRGWER